VDLGGYVAVARRRALAILLCVIAGLVGGIYLGTAPAKTYRATAEVFVSLPATGSTEDQLASTQIAGAYVATYAKIATSQDVAQRVVSVLHLPLSANAVQGALSASPETGTYIIGITSTDGDAARAAAIANAAASALSEVVGSFRSAGSQDVTVATIDEAQVPGSPISPRPKLDTLLGLVVGLVVGVALAGLLEALDRTVKSGPQAAQLAGAPTLGLIPRRRGGLGAATQESAHDVAAEAYRSLRTAVRFLDPDRPLRTILVTSASPSAGKTTTAANLAISLARGGERVIVVDCDLRRAGLGHYFGLESAVGITSILRRQARLRDALQNAGPNLRVLPSGPLPPNPAELLGSQSMATLLDQLAVDADVVILDAPPVLPVTDAVVLATQVDGVIVVARHGKTLRSAATEASRRLRGVNADVVGVVLNGVPVSEAREYYVEYVYQEIQVPRRSRPAPNPESLSTGDGPQDTHEAARR
jgi:succinoglycan biosynthesis transport protein ExoP